MLEADAGQVVQPKLAIGVVDDPLEHEADRVAEQVMRKESGPARVNTSTPPMSGCCTASEQDDPIVHAGVTDDVGAAAGRALSRKCAACEGEEVNKLQMKPAGGAAATAAPAVVHEALRASGRPLDHATRAFMEPRFGCDFSHVRVHTDMLASRSAEAVAARAYTVGPNIVFRRGEYAPGTAAGRSLLAHELTHVVQQSGAQPATLRRVHVDTAGRKQFDSPDFAGDPKLEACLNGEDRLRSGARGESVAKVQRGLLKDGADLGPTGADGVYGRLTEAAVREFKKKHTLGSQQFGDVGPGTMAQLDALGTSPTPTPPAPTPPAPAPPAPPPPSPVCGPDVRQQLVDVVAATRSAYAGWSPNQKEEACWALENAACGPTCWDIVELHNADWIFTNYRPACATAGGTPPCGQTVKVGSGCHYHGSPNYVIFGVMASLCGMWRATVQTLIWLYKHSAGNYDASKAWALAGYDGWPGVADPVGDRPNCIPSCPTPYSGPPFTLFWYPVAPTEAVSPECENALQIHRDLSDDPEIPVMPF